jgi:nucleoside 2-deoxyribosyltransferase
VGDVVRFYIASGLPNAESVRDLRDLLVRAGHVHTYDWTEHGSVAHGGPSLMCKTAECELHGVLTADVVIVLLPGGRGTHVEMGAALASGKRVLLVGDAARLNDPCAFYHHPRVVRVTDPSQSTRFLIVTDMLAVAEATRGAA